MDPELVIFELMPEEDNRRTVSDLMLRGMVFASKAMAGAAALGVVGAPVYHLPIDSLSPTVLVRTFTARRGSTLPSYDEQPVIELGSFEANPSIRVGIHFTSPLATEEDMSYRRVPEVQHLSSELPGIENAVASALDEFEKQDSIQGLQVEVDVNDIAYPITIWVQSSLEGEERQQLKRNLRLWWNEGFPKLAGSLLIAVL